MRQDEEFSPGAGVRGRRGRAREAEGERNMRARTTQDDARQDYGGRRGTDPVRLEEKEATTEERGEERGERLSPLLREKNLDRNSHLKPMIRGERSER